MGELSSLIKAGDILTFTTLLFVIYLFASNIMGRFKKIKIGNAVEFDEAQPQGKPQKDFVSFEYFFNEFRTLRKDILEIRGLFLSTHQDIKSLSDSVQNIKIDQQKQIFYDTDQRPSERLMAGLRYVSHGRNGEVKADVIKFAQDNPVIYQTIITAIPELRLPDFG